MAEEISQDVFLAFYTNAANAGNEPWPYIIGILKHKVADYYRSKLANQTLSLSDEDEDIFLGRNDVLDYIYDKEMNAQLENEIEKLPEQCRKVFILRRHHQLSNKEIADRLNISVNTVEQHMRRALRILRENLDYYTMLGLLLALSEAATAVLS